MYTRIHSLSFPALLVAPPALVVALVAAGMAPASALTVAVLLLIGLLTLLEHRWPFRREWSVQPKGETVTDVAYIALASVPDRLTRMGIEVMAVWLIGWTAVRSSDVSWTRSLLLAGLAFVLADLGKYLIHRVSHSVPWLWRFHLAHHQPERLSALNALRLHPVNMAYNAAIDTVPLLLLGVSPSVAAVLAAVRATVGVVQHANIDVERGRQWLVNAPSYHRTHHDVDADRAHYNFGSVLLVWDRLFGSLKRAPAPDVVGVEQPVHRLPSGYIGQLVYPWCGATLYTTCLFSRVPWIVR